MEYYPTAMTQLFLTLIMALIMGLLCSHLAQNKGRLYSWWFVCGVFFGIFALVFLFFLPPIGFRNHQKSQHSDKEPQKDAEPSAKAKAAKQEEEEWFYLNDEWTQCGPVSLTRIKELYGIKQLDMTSYLWHPTMSDWQQLKEVKYQGKEAENIF